MDLFQATATAVGVMIALFIALLVMISRPVPPGDPLEDIDDATGGTAPAPGARYTGASSSGTRSGAPVTCKQLLIEKCDDPMMWYANLVGKKVDYLGTWPSEGHKSREPAGYINIVKLGDARIVIDETDSCEVK